MYIGVNNTARKASKAYLGVGNIARKITKGYLGVGNIARLVYSGAKQLSYYGTATALSVGRQQVAGCSVGDYALAMGGQYYDSQSYSVSLSAVDAYNTSLQRSTPTSLSVARYGLAAALVGDYALAMGGRYDDIEDQGNYYDSNTVNAYNTSLQRSTPTSLSVARYGLAAASVGDYALAMGGRTSGASSGVSSTVDAYNTSLQRSTPTNLSVARSTLAAASVGDYALAMGGQAGAPSSAVVDAYNTSLQRSTPTALSAAKSSLTGLSMGDYALAAGGNIAAVDAYNASLQRSTPAGLSVSRNSPAGATTGNFGLFMGGSSDVVDVYQVT